MLNKKNGLTHSKVSKFINYIYIILKKANIFPKTLYGAITYCMFQLLRLLKDIDFKNVQNF